MMTTEAPRANDASTAPAVCGLRLATLTGARLVAAGVLFRRTGSGCAFTSNSPFLQ
jgi:hypothetical protein